MKSLLQAVPQSPFLRSRAEVIRLTPVLSASSAGYVWSRVFLKAEPRGGR